MYLLTSRILYISHMYPPCLFQYSEFHEVKTLFLPMFEIPSGKKKKKNSFWCSQHIFLLMQIHSYNSGSAQFSLVNTSWLLIAHSWASPLTASAVGI